MKKVLTALVVLLSFVSCKKYELEGKIDNEDFVGRWINPNASHHGYKAINFVEIRSNGDYASQGEYKDGSKTRKTKKSKVIIEIQGEKYTREIRRGIDLVNLFNGENYFSTHTILVSPTRVDTFYYDQLSGLRVDCSGYYVVRLEGLPSGYGTTFFKIP